MRIVSIKILKEFRFNYLDSEQHLKAWVGEVKQANWQLPTDIKDKYHSAVILKNRHIFFNIKGNDYRLIVSVA